MSDIADDSDSKIQNEIACGIQRSRLAKKLVPKGYCWFCDCEVDRNLLFCDGDCRDDFQREEQALRRAGIYS